MAATRARPARFDSAGNPAASDIRVLVADGHPVMRLGYAALLNGVNGCTVVGEAADGAVAVAEYGRLCPDVLLLELSLPGMDGWDALTRVLAIDPKARVLIVSDLDGDEDVHRAIAAGALGYLHKHSSTEDVVGAIRAVASGARRLSLGAATALAKRSQYPPLTTRETDVLRALADGLSNRQIGIALGITGNTVKNHVSNVLHKLAVADRTAAVALAIARGITRGPHPLPRKD